MCMHTNMHAHVYTHACTCIQREGGRERLIFIFLLFTHRESASCTHISGLLHGLVAMTPANFTSTITSDQTVESHDNDDGAETLPVTSFACQWKPPRKRKDSVLKFADTNFEKHTYG